MPKRDDWNTSGIFGKADPRTSTLGNVPTIPTTRSVSLSPIQLKAIESAARKLKVQSNVTRDATPYRPATTKATVVPPDTGLGVLFGSTAKKAGEAAQAAATKKLSTGTSTKKTSSSSHTSSGGGSSGPSTKDLITQIYDQLVGNLGEQKTASMADYDATKSTIQSQYDAAQKDLYDKYIATQNPIAEQAASLGILYKDSSIEDLQDAAMKRLEETANLSEATDLSWIDKMKLLQGGAFDAMIQGSRNDQAAAILNAQQAALAAAAARARRNSGGGGGGGGSGKATGSVTDTAKDVYTYPDRGEWDYIESISDPALRKSLELGYVRDNVKGGSSLYSRATAPTVKVPSVQKGSPFSASKIFSAVKKGAAISKNKKITADKSAALAEIAAKLKYVLNMPSKVTTVTQTGTSKKKTYGS